MSDISISDVDPVAIEAFLKVRGQVTAYWTVKYKALSGFFRFLIARGYLDISPLPATNPKVPERRAPHIYTLDELKKLKGLSSLCPSFKILADPNPSITIHN
jgi:site-specific recombinase XerD